MTTINNFGDFVNPDGKKIIMFGDTTLRDGHQCPGAGISGDKIYLSIARGISHIGIDVIEAGFPSSSPHELWRVKTVAEMAGDGEIAARIAGLTQMVASQVEKTLCALEPLGGSGRGLVHLYFPVDPALREASIGNKVSNAEAIQQVENFTRLAVQSGLQVQFSLEGFSRIDDNFDFGTDLVRAAVSSGATYINYPDTIGGEDPQSRQKEYYVKTIQRLIAIVNQEFPGNSVIHSVHNHNDLGLAVENSMVALALGTGITKVEGTIGGIGERAGNADLVQIIVRMLTTLSDQYDVSHINPAHISEVAQLISQSMLPTQAHYPNIGGNAFTHTSGGHTNALLKDPTVYQPYDPALVGGKISFVYGPNSGSNLAVHKLTSLGYHCPDQQKRDFDIFLKSRMQETGRYKGLSDDEVLEGFIAFQSPLTVNNYSIKSSSSGKVEAQFQGKFFGETDIFVSGKTILSALEGYITRHMPGRSIHSFSAQSRTEGIDSPSIATIMIKNVDTGLEITGVSENQDIELSSLEALAKAYNVAYIKENFKTKE